MEKLLQWAVQNSDKEELQRTAEAVRSGNANIDPKKFDPAVIEAILGKDDATRMKEALQCICDPEDTIENKEIALDNFELLIEGIDNAKNIENMKLWPQIIGQLGAKEVEVRKGIAWICGTAVQNNPEAQKAFLNNGGLEPLLNLLKNKDEDKEVRSKAQYAISGFLKHFPEGMTAFKELNGFDAFVDIVQRDEDPAIVRKVIFLYNILMLDDRDLAILLIQKGSMHDLDTIIAKYTEADDEDMVEKALRALYTMLSESNTPTPPDAKKHAQEAASKFGQANLGLDKSEWSLLVK
ncbi:armadillo-type protein [Radiomyces spectabilis]|uniref:armadillo-type protein n=1 Tax=Radiomyces spectabilis TaxID=64574 RepID=UPI0022210E84|nr:armadillo-type protein [Radiomyces spectabilis]KAI8372954.1 armadillo-type protein [Radiomyces spectabilis]